MQLDSAPCYKAKFVIAFLQKKKVNVLSWLDNFSDT